MKYGKIVDNKEGRWLEHFTETAGDILKINAMPKENKHRNDDPEFKHCQQPILVRIDEGK